MMAIMTEDPLRRKGGFAIVEASPPPRGHRCGQHRAHDPRGSDPFVDSYRRCPQDRWEEGGEAWPACRPGRC